MGLTGLAAALWNRVCVVPVLLVRGERDLRRGRIVTARLRFTEAVRRAPTCFRARFGLARVHVAARDPDAARRELAIARHLSPSRYRELVRALPAAFRDASQESARERSRREVVLLGETSRPGRPAFRDDFLDAAERERFRRRGPITDDERRAIDWDRLAAELGRRDR